MRVNGMLKETSSPARAFFRRKGLANSEIITYNKKEANDKGGISP